MPLTIRRIVADVSFPEKPNTTITLRDQTTQAVLGSVTLDAQGLGSILLPFELYLAAVAGGRASGAGSVATPGAHSAGAGGDAEGSGTLSQALPISGAAGGQGAGSGAPSRDQALEGAAQGDAGGVALPNVVTPGQLVGAADGQAGVSGAPVVNPALAGAAQGAAGLVGSSAQELPVAGSAAGAAAGEAAASIEQGAGGSFLPADPEFNGAVSPVSTPTSPAVTDGRWEGYAAGGPSNIADRFASTEISGAYVGRLVASPVSDGKSTSSTYARLRFSRTRAYLDASSGSVSFKFRPKQAPLGASFSLTIRSIDGSGAADVVTVPAQLNLPNTPNTTTTHTVSVVTELQSRLRAGKTLADVAGVSVDVTAVSGSTSGTTAEAYVDQFT